MEVGSAFVTLIPSAKGFGSAIDRQIGGDLKGAGDRGGRAYGAGLTTGLSRESKGLKGVGASGGKAIGAGMTGAMAGVASKVFLPIAAAMGGLAIGKFFAEGVKGASSLEEAGAAVTAVFGSAAGDVQKFASTANTQLGQTRLQALQAAQTFGTFGKAAGLSGKDLGGFSTDLVTLATDLAAFKDTSPEQAIEAVGAALRGESEPIRAYGVLLDDATLKQRALALGLIKTTKTALTPQQRVLAAQAELFVQTTDAQGNWIDTQAGLAAQQKILSAQWSDMKTTLGGALLPAITKIATMFNSLLGPALENAGPFVTKLSAGFTNLFKSGEGGASFLTPLINGFKQFGATVGPALASLAGPLKSFFGTLIPVFKSVAQSIMGTLVPGFKAIGDAIAGKLIPAVKVLLPVLAPVAAFLLKTLGGAITGALSGAIKVIQGLITAVSGLVMFVVNIFKGEWGAAWQGLKDVVSGVFSAIVGAIQVFLNVGILKLFRVGLSALMGLWRGGLNLLKGAASALWNAIIGVFRGAFTGIKNIIVASIRVYVTAWRGLFTTIFGVVRAGWNFVRGLFSTAFNFIKSLISGTIKNIVTVWRGLFSTITNVVRSGWNFIKGLFSSAFNAIKSLVSGTINNVLTVWRGLFTKMTSFVRDGINNVKEVFSGLKDKVLGAISGAASWLVNTGKNIVNGLINGIKGMAGAIKDALLGLLPGPLKRFASALGITSPSKVFAKFGEQMGAGLVVGLDGSGKNVGRSVGRLADTAQRALGTPVRASSMTVGAPVQGGSGIVFNGPVTSTDVQRLADEIVKRQRDALVLAGAMGV